MIDPRSPRALRLASRRFTALLACISLLFVAFLAACSEPPPKPVPVPVVTPGPGETPAAPTPAPGPNPSAWLADVQPFSPTLAHLFDQGRIVALPLGKTPAPPANFAQWAYAFSCVDRYGRLYHFDSEGRWWMDRGWALTEPLPPGEWDAAWNPASGALELLVTAPYAGSPSVQLFRWKDGVWRAVQQEHPPLGRRESKRLFSATASTWLVAGGMVEDAVTTHVTVSLPPRPASATLLTTPTSPTSAINATTITITTTTATITTTTTLSSATLQVAADTLVTTRTVPVVYATTQGLSLAEGVWSDWISPATDDNPTSTNLGRVVALVDGPSEEGVGVLFSSGRLWHWRAGAWTPGMNLPADSLWMAQYLPEYRSQLFVWQHGMGLDQIYSRPAGTQPTSGTQQAAPSPAQTAFQPDMLTQTALVRINEDEDGLWQGWGRVPENAQSGPDAEKDFKEGFAGPGHAAVSINSDHGNTIFLRRDLQAIELPQQLSSLTPRGAAFVPALAGVVVPSNAGLGIDSRLEPFFPPEAADGQSTASAPLVEVIERNVRLWVFKPTTVVPIQPPDQIHPSIGFPLSMELADGRRRFLTWNFPEPGIFRYEYLQTSQQNEQWLPSPSLTLKNLPLLNWSPEKQLFLAQPVVWGDPARVVLLGWYGNLSDLLSVDDPEADGVGDDAYETIPQLAFMASIDARNPQDWTISELPIPFCQGAELVVDTAQDRLYLLGGKMSVPRNVDGKDLHFMVPNTVVWEWDGASWSKINPEGNPPNLKITSATSFDPTLRKVISLTPDKFYGFDGVGWSRLWKTDKDIDWPRQIGLYVHPISRTILGIWFEPQPRLAIWNGEDWKRVHTAAEQQNLNLNEAATIQHALPRKREDLVPAMEPGAYVSIDADRLAAIRMDLPRDRSLDRLVEAYWVRFLPLTKPEKPPKPPTP